MRGVSVPALFSSIPLPITFLYPRFHLSTGLNFGFLSTVCEIEVQTLRSALYVVTCHVFHDMFVLPFQEIKHMRPQQDSETGMFMRSSHELHRLALPRPAPPHPSPTHPTPLASKIIMASLAQASKLSLCLQTQPQLALPAKNTALHNNAVLDVFCPCHVRSLESEALVPE